MLVAAPGRFSTKNCCPVRSDSHCAINRPAKSAGAKPDNQAHRPGRIRLRPCEARGAQCGGGARGKMQEVATGKFHGDAPRPCAPPPEAVGSREQNTFRAFCQEDTTCLPASACDAPACCR